MVGVVEVVDVVGVVEVVVVAGLAEVAVVAGLAEVVVGVVVVVAVVVVVGVVPALEVGVAPVPEPLDVVAVPKLLAWVGAGWARVDAVAVGFAVAADDAAFGTDRGDGRAACADASLGSWPGRPP